MPLQPYYRSIDQLPGPLPTLEDIKAAAEAQDAKGDTAKARQERISTAVARRAATEAHEKSNIASKVETTARLSTRPVNRFGARALFFNRFRQQQDCARLETKVDDSRGEERCEESRTAKIVSEEISKEAPPLEEIRIVKIKEYFIVKYGTNVRENEGRALLFLEKHPTIPSPTLYAMFQEGRMIYLVMGEVRGERLSDIWPYMTEEEDKPEIARQLRCILDDLRSIPPSVHQFSNITGGPMPHQYFWSEDGDSSITGPFNSEHAFGLALGLKSQAVQKEKHIAIRRDREYSTQERDLWMHNYTPDFFCRHLPRALGNHKPVLTHSALHPDNILIYTTNPKLVKQPNGEYTEEPGGIFVGGIVNWENFGWYPTYWEYASSFIHFKWLNDWSFWFEKIVEPWPSEAAVLKLVHDNLTS